MAKKKSAAPQSWVGLWRIVSMEEWEEEYLHEEVQAFIELDDRGGGEFQFGYVSGYIDWRAGPSSGDVEWTWEGEDGADGTSLFGRGRAQVVGNELHGIIHIHQGELSGFIARLRKQKAPKKK